MAKIVLRPKNVRDVSAADLEPLAEELRTLDGGSEVSIDVPPEQRTAVTLSEIVDMIVHHVDDAVIGAASAMAVGWAKKRFAKQEEKVKKSINIYGPDNQVIRRIEVDDPDTEPTISERKK